MVDDYTYQGFWTIKRIENLGFKLISNEKQWYHFKRHNFNVMINLETEKGLRGNFFNLHLYKNSFKGNFKAIINTKQQFINLLNTIV